MQMQMRRYGTDTTAETAADTTAPDATAAHATAPDATAPDATATEISATAHVDAENEVES